MNKNIACTAINTERWWTQEQASFTSDSLLKIKRQRPGGMFGRKELDRKFFFNKRINLGGLSAKIARDRLKNSILPSILPEASIHSLFSRSHFEITMLINR